MKQRTTLLVVAGMLTGAASGFMLGDFTSMETGGVLSVAVILQVLAVALVIRSTAEDVHQ